MQRLNKPPRDLSRRSTARFCLRITPAWRLHALEELPAAQRRAIWSAAASQSVAGIAVHTLSASPTIALSREAFGVISGLGEGREVLGSGELAALVLDGLLEVDGANGWCSGPPALNVVGTLVPEVPAAPAPASIADLSRAAVRNATSVADPRVTRVAEQLYRYNRWPASPEWSRRWGTATAVTATTESVSTGELLRAAWRQVPARPGNDRWRIYRHRDARLLTRDAPMCKLYVGVAPPAVDAALSAALPVLTALGVPEFKLAADMYGMLRPDKFVCYMSDSVQLDEVASALEIELAGQTVHAVPFTAAWSRSGLLSWAVDPPRKGDLSGAGAESWRGWVVSRLARAIVMAAALPSPDDRWRYALRRVRLDGIDTASWSLVAAPEATPR